MDQEILNSYSKLNDLNVSRETFLDFENYISMIIEKNKKINIISENTASKKSIINRHIIDSAQIIDFIDLNSNTTTDLGSGGGFPGIIVAIILKNMKNNMNVHLYEKSYHKSHFLKEVSKKLNLKTKVFQKNIFEIKNLETGELLTDKIENTTGGSVWSNDNKTLFYTKKDPLTLRSSSIYRHILGTDASEDVIVFEEKDETYSTYVYKTKSHKFIVIGSSSTLSSEFRIISADKPYGDWKVIHPREDNLEYSLAHYGDYFYIQTNKDDAINFKLMKTPVNKTTKEHWVDVIPHRNETLLEDVSIFKNYLVIEERSNGLGKIRIKAWDGKEDYYLPFNEETYSTGVYANPEFDTDVIRYSYNSMTTPNSVIDFNMKNQTKEIKKEQEVLGGKFDKNNYKSDRIWATARDGKKVAISLVYHKDTELNKNTPLLQYAYGSYGYTISDGFSSTRLSLLDRGFVYAVAHIRGGQYLGREWYNDGKMMNKKNSFFDFIDCSKYLIDNNYTSAKHLYAMGGSAGGLLVGAVSNLNPELYNGIIAAVPFVDVISTMLDESIPLTTGEFDEWGNPKEKEAYDYMLSY